VPQAVVVGFDMTLSYDRLCKAAYWISTGLPFIATHPDMVCPTDQSTVLVDCGAICACLTAATGRWPVVLGKPDPAILLNLCVRHAVAPEEMAMVGDRIYTDIVMAQKAGAVAVLVLSGEAIHQPTLLSATSVSSARGSIALGLPNRDAKARKRSCHKAIGPSLSFGDNAWGGLSSDWTGVPLDVYFLARLPFLRWFGAPSSERTGAGRDSIRRLNLALIACTSGLSASVTTL
jgi:hypothetical protein